MRGENTLFSILQNYQIVYKSFVKILNTLFPIYFKNKFSRIISLPNSTKFSQERQTKLIMFVFGGGEAFCVKLHSIFVLGVGEELAKSRFYLGHGTEAQDKIEL